MKPLSVVLMHSPQSRQLHTLHSLPLTALRTHRSSHEFELEVSVDGLGQCVVLAIPDSHA